MVTTKVFDDLKELQGILVQKYELEEKVESAPKQLSNQEDLLAKTQKEFIELKTEYDNVQEKIVTLKSDLDAAVKSREEGENGVANSTTHRDYENFEKQINEAKEKEDDVRKQLQREEKSVADLNDKLKTTEESITFLESELKESRDNLSSEVDGYKKELAELQAQEDKITPDLDQEILFKFERIIQRNSEGIVAVRNGVCTGCHMILPADFANEVREGENIKFCPYCSRILYYEDVAEEQQEDFFNIGDAGSLAGFDDLLDEDEEAAFDDDDKVKEVAEDSESEASDDDSEDESDED